MSGPHRLRIIDNTAKEQWDYECSCGILIGWITQPATHPRIRQAAHQFIRAWEDHTTRCGRARKHHDQTNTHPRTKKWPASTC